ncbi:MAG: hypothetical protein AAFR54_22115 [Planctomycetota bacterium]
MLSLLCLSLAVPVQDPTPLILEGDPTPDGFVVQFLGKMIVASDGSWVVGVNTTNTDTGIDDYLLRDGVPFLTPGDPIPGLGSGLDFYLDFDHAGAGLTAYTGTTLAGDGFAVLEDSLLAVEGDALPAFLGLPAGTTWQRIEDVQVVPSGRVMLPVQIQQPGVSGTTSAIVVFETDAAHQITGGHVAAIVGRTLSSGETADFVFTSENETRINDSGQVFWWGFDSAGSGILAVDDQVVATSNSPSPEPGLDWRSFAGPELDLNDSGEWIARAQVTSFPRDVVMASDGLVARQSSSHPAFPAFTAGDFGFNAPVFIANDGREMFYVDMSGTGSTADDEGYVVGDALVVREGVTQAGGNTIVAVSDGRTGYRMSRNGSHLIFEADVDDGGVIREGAFLLSLAAPGVGTNYCTAVPNSTGVPASIAATGSDVFADNDLSVVATSLPLNTFGIFVVSQTQGNVPMAGGEGTLCLGGAIGRYQNQIVNSGAGGTFGLDIDLTAVPSPTMLYAATPGTTWRFQCWYRDADPAPTSNTTDAVELMLR